MTSIQLTNLSIYKKILKKLENETSLKCEVDCLLDGRNNKVIKIIDRDGMAYALKIYTRDDIGRLEREFIAYKLLHSKGIHSTPKSLWKDKESYCAVYSFLEGEKKNGENVRKEDIDQIVQFILKVQSLPNHNCLESIPSNFERLNTINAYKEGILKRMRVFEESQKHKEFTSTPDIDYFRNNVLESLAKLEGDIGRKGMSHTFSECFDNGDFGIHNMLFNNGKVQFFDFEYWNWNGRFRPIGNFLHCAPSHAISKENKEHFLKCYIKSASIPSEDRALLNDLLRVAQLEWVVVRLSSLSDRVIKIRESTVPDFDTAEYVKTQTESFKKHLAEYQKKYH